jgi:hypothetical protein
LPAGHSSLAAVYLLARSCGTLVTVSIAFSSTDRRLLIAACAILAVVFSAGVIIGVTSPNEAGVPAALVPLGVTVVPGGPALESDAAGIEFSEPLVAMTASSVADSHEAEALAEPLAAGEVPPPEMLVVPLKPADLSAEIRAFAFVELPAPEPDVPPPPVTSCTTPGGRPPPNPPRIVLPDGSFATPAYAEFKDSAGRNWIWDGSTWRDKLAAPGDPEPC